MNRMMHLGLLAMGAGGHVAGWRMPDAEWGSENLSLLRRMAQAAERGRFDLFFLADAVNTGLDAHPGMMVRFEPLTLLSALAMCTGRIGLGATVSTTYSEPYNVARALASLDHLSGGRAAWNVVTGSSPDAAANFSRDSHPPHAERYAMAAEYLQVAKGLWDSWEDGAIVGDKASGTFADGTKMHVLNHEGRYFKVKGPLNITRPPQGYPVILQAGASDAGRDLAAATAEVVFTVQQEMDAALAFAQDLRDRCAAAGRPRDAIRILPGVCIVLGRDAAEAKARIAELAKLAHPDAALRVLSDRLGHDLSRFDLDAPVPELPPSGMMQGHAVTLAAVARRHRMTLRELRDYTAASSGHRVLFGTPEEVADDLEAWFRSGAADGFMIKTTHYPGPFEEVIDRVVPILVRRGLFRAEYEGSTLREHLGLPRPAHPAQASVPQPAG
ncbi:LLM class flavin-dependent oxidoreductase [Pseudoroseomonas wenyumeiae]|uniref:LLM class flavin-dependent oxidoreductase n=1 Tax=Teichococcus wenyumeiae TaxID=2478470 RepID=A0A3A9JDY7_9PROT|nr:LLM class flavin-dependent oxidoreductase [Pseudoroseomonas wenyumeiae]RKK03601.1 LLM class flavin-dependent oxidoreductase [Pseudoroseomonas wenyumeiae]RMI27079.1 LLM class flavin-dependent oxidoreductase [Pseudoroseomonas wenyumeiae]